MFTPTQPTMVLVKLRKLPQRDLGQSPVPQTILRHFIRILGDLAHMF